MELYDPITIFYICALILMCGYVVFYTIKKLIVWKNSVLVEAKIIGYKWKGKSYWKRIFSNAAGFYPVVKYKIDDREIITPIRNLDILIPERDIKVRICKDNHSTHVQLDFLYGLFGISAILLVISFIYTDINMNYGFYSFISLIPVMVSIYLWDNYRNFGTLQDALNYIQPQKIDEHSQINEELLKSVEEAELVTYQQAMAHYNYCVNRPFHK